MEFACVLATFISPCRVLYHPQNADCLRRSHPPAPVGIHILEPQLLNRTPSREERASSLGKITFASTCRGILQKALEQHDSPWLPARKPVSVQQEKPVTEEYRQLPRFEGSGRTSRITTAVKLLTPTELIPRAQMCSTSFRASGGLHSAGPR